MDQDRDLPAQSEAVEFRDRLREHRGDSRIDSIATRLEHVEAGIAGLVVPRNDDASRAHDIRSRAGGDGHG